MKAKDKVVYVPPVYEDVQHEVTSVDDNNTPLRTSFHTDVSLLQRIDNMRDDAQTLYPLKVPLPANVPNGCSPANCVSLSAVLTISSNTISALAPPI